MQDAKPDPSERSRLRQLALSRWENEGGSTSVDLVREMATCISPRPGFTRHRLTVQGGGRHDRPASAGHSVSGTVRRQRVHTRRKEQHMKVREIMTRSVVSVSPDTPVSELAELLIERRISAVPVIEGDALVGIVSEADLLHRYEIGTERKRAARPWWQRLFADQESPWGYVESHAKKVRDIMTANVVSVAEDMAAGEVAELFESRHIRRVPVVRGEKVVGIVSRTDFVRALVARGKIRRHEHSKSDESIRRAVLAELESHPWWRPLYSHVTVVQGVVHVSGLLESPEEKDAVRVAAENVEGVRGVDDERRTLYIPPGGYW
jgi:CBS domain-containing protein